MVVFYNICIKRKEIIVPYEIIKCINKIGNYPSVIYLCNMENDKVKHTFVKGIFRKDTMGKSLEIDENKILYKLKNKNIFIDKEKRKVFEVEQDNLKVKQIPDGEYKTYDKIICGVYNE